jgi:DNA-binding Lrp family transcriptional regulator
LTPVASLAHRVQLLTNLDLRPILPAIGARISPVGSGYYSAAKSALEGITRSLRGEVAPLGITAMVVDHPEVIAAYTITGESDALLHLRAASIGALESVIERIRAHPNAERTNSRVVLSRLVHRPVL